MVYDNLPEDLSEAGLLVEMDEGPGHPKLPVLLGVYSR